MGLGFGVCFRKWDQHVVSFRGPSGRRSQESWLGVLMMCWGYPGQIRSRPGWGWHLQAPLSIVEGRFQLPQHTPSPGSLPCAQRTVHGLVRGSVAVVSLLLPIALNAGHLVDGQSTGWGTLSRPNHHALLSLPVIPGLHLSPPASTAPLKGTLGISLSCLGSGLRTGAT